MAKVIFFDTETTGLDELDRIIQIAVAVYSKKDGVVSVEAFSEYCKAPVPISYQAMSTHHITPEKIANAPVFSELEPAKLLTDPVYDNPSNYLVAHNADYDLRMLLKEGVAPKCKVIDTYQVALHLFAHDKRFECFKLQYLRYFLELYKQEEAEIARFYPNRSIDAHDALGDVIVLALFFQYILTHYRHQYTLDDLVALSNKPALIHYITFGKHIGKALNTIVWGDVKWADWALKNLDDPNMLYSINYYRSNKEKIKGVS